MALVEDDFHGMVEGLGDIVLVPRETAERAADVADIGEVDVSADDEGDVVSLVLLPSDVCGPQQGVKIRPLGREQRNYFVSRELTSGQGRIENSGDLGVHIGK